MADYQLIIIGGGLSGIAAGIRAARFGRKTLILEQHSLPGGLNSYYFRQGHLLETGLHAMTNCALPGDKRAPLNRLFRQLHLSRKQFVLREQIGSEIRFSGRKLAFANDCRLLEEEIAREFPAVIDRFRLLRREILQYDPFQPGPWRSARQFLAERLGVPLLEDMLLLPLMIYGNAEEHDMDLGQFAIMFRAVFEEGFFRPVGTMREFLELLVNQYLHFGGAIRYRCPVAKILVAHGRIQGVRLADGEELTAEAVLSTAGIPETIRLSGWDLPQDPYCGRMSFMETIALLPSTYAGGRDWQQTIIFYHTGKQLRYQRPSTFIDTSWGVICFPENFQDQIPAELRQVRVTNAANYSLWKALSTSEYLSGKEQWATASIRASEEVIGPYQHAVVYRDSFTPLTIERYTRKAHGAIYGSAVKIKDGVTPWPNLFIAGTDQGFLGIIGAMLSGITVVNRHLLQ
ncbi:NAD(P)/FAD-dependent oxidoreductase [Desulfobulbus alkaliphilus]|nr:NAD(P)/FAD-dependent oxidoreductase [Desulfobulbus alkaliphilus]